MWMVRLLVFGPVVAVIAAAWLLWQGWSQQPEWQPPQSGREVIWLREIGPLEQALGDPAWGWLWRGQVSRQLLRLDEQGRVRPDLVKSWRSYQTTRLFFRNPDDAEEAGRRLHDLGAERWVAWGLSKVEVREEEFRVRFDRSNEEAAAEVVDLMADLSLIPLTRLRVSARDHAEQLAREFIEEGTEVGVVKSLWLDGFEAFEMILAGGSDRVSQELELRLAARPGLEPRMEMTAHGRRLDEMVLEMDLDPEARWHDGRAFTSADVMELTDRWRAGFGVLPEPRARVGTAGIGFGPRGGSDWPGSDLFRRIMSWERESEHRVAVSFWQPKGSLLSPWTEVPVLRLERTEAGERLLGCGPVEVREWSAGERVVLRERGSVRLEGGSGSDQGQDRLRRLVDASLAEIEWRQAHGSDVTIRRAEMGLVKAVEVGRSGRNAREDAFFERAQWRAIDTRCQADWWLVWVADEGEGADRVGNDSGSERLDRAELRVWLMSLIDRDQLSEAGGAGVRPWRAWWLEDQKGAGKEQQEERIDELEFEARAPLRVVLETANGDGGGRLWMRELTSMWEQHGVGVEWRAAGMAGDATVADAEDDRIVLRARLVRVRPDNPLAWATLWHGSARSDGGDARMDELVRQFGDALEQGHGLRLAPSIDLRVRRLGWGTGLVREVRRLRVAPRWLIDGSEANAANGGLRSLLLASAERDGVVVAVEAEGGNGNGENLREGN